MTYILVNVFTIHWILLFIELDGPDRLLSRLYCLPTPTNQGYKTMHMAKSHVRPNFR